MPDSKGNPSPETPKPAAAKAKAITVKVVGPNPLGEAGGPYSKGDTFETTPERRKALGALVTDV